MYWLCWSKRKDYPSNEPLDDRTSTVYGTGSIETESLTEGDSKDTCKHINTMEDSSYMIQFWDACL